MTFLYVGLGLAMISGISAMMQIGNNINNMSTISTFKRDAYFTSDFPNYDREILVILNNLSTPNEDVCVEVKEKLNNDLYTLGTPFLSNGKRDSTIDFFEGSCTLQNNEHRILIKENDLGTYDMFSCHLDGKSYCSFEEDQ